MIKSVALGAAALSVQAFALVALNRRIEPFVYHYYVLSWWSYIFLVDAIQSLRQHRFLIANRRLPFLVLISCAFWCFFEILNLRLRNWFYINIPDYGYVRYAGYLIAFGTVIPGIYVTKETLRLLVGDVSIRPVRLPNRLSVLCLSGATILILTMLLPQYLFPLTWVFLIPILDGFSYSRGLTSFIGDLERGKAGNLISTILAGMICGFLWEIWNYWAISKWVYTVPLFEDTKLFEMPLFGYIGFAFFAVETIAFLNLSLEAKPFQTHSYFVVALALLFSLLSFTLIERYTVFSRLAEVAKLQFISHEERKSLEKEGVTSSYAIEGSRLSQEERQFIDLIHLKGLGLDHTMLLREKGIDSVSALSALSPAQLCAIIGEEEKRRCRVYIKAAGGSDLSY